MNKEQALKEYFGHDQFRPGQSELIDALLAGHDALGIMPTGAGKSACYQIPALLLTGITLVVSPLISLMKDQVSALRASGVPAAYINSSLSPAQQSEALRRAALNRYRIIYVAPERLDVAEFLQFAHEARLSLIAVDEAHCVSQWGQDFRPSYLKIADFIDHLPVRPPVGAFTATATPQVKLDIVRLLRLRSPREAITGFDRPNLHFAIQKPKDKYASLTDVIHRHAGESGIVYCATRKTVESVCDRLQEDGCAATRYHAGLSDEERRENQDSFQFDRANVMVATNAFGMGIDKSNVSFIVHYNMPKNLESYYQEAGRAGRDGSEAECLLLYSGQDVMTARWMIEHGEENSEQTPEERALVRERDLERLKQMTFYATSKRCLRGFIRRYFGEAAPNRCDNCSVCNQEAYVPTEIAPREPAIPRAERTRTRRTSGGRNADTGLMGALKRVRKQLADSRHVPAYIIFTDASLQEMDRMRPVTPAEFRLVSGVGVTKAALYGDAFLSVIQQYEDTPLPLEDE